MEKEYILKNGQSYVIREAVPEDAGGMLDFLDCVAAESDNLTFGPGEMNIPLEKEKAFIRNCRESDNRLFLTAVINGRVIGNLSIDTGTKPRTAHIGEFGVSVVKDFWGNGVATNLIITMFDWAREHSITKINLKVKEDNEIAVALYEKLGFAREGLLTRDFRINGKYYSSIAMGKIID